VIELKFDDSNKLVGWAVGNSSNPHSIQHSYLQYVEKKGDILERGINVCDGTNVYTFVPDNGRNTLTPKVIPTTLVANGPLVWEVEQQINSVSSSLFKILKVFTHWPSMLCFSFSV